MVLDFEESMFASGKNDPRPLPGDFLPVKTTAPMKRELVLGRFTVD
jgi:hypothetical protein